MSNLSSALNYTLGVQNMLRSIAKGEPKNNPRIINWIDARGHNIESFTRVDADGYPNTHYVSKISSDLKLDPKKLLVMDDDNNFCQISNWQVKSFYGDDVADVYRVDMYPVNKNEYFFITPDLMDKINDLPVENHILDARKTDYAINLYLDGRNMVQTSDTSIDKAKDIFYDVCIEMTPFALMDKEMSNGKIATTPDLRGEMEVLMQNELNFADDNTWYSEGDYKKSGISSIINEQYMSTDWEAISNAAFSVLNNKDETVIKYNTFDDLSDDDVLNLIAQRFDGFTRDDLKIGNDLACKHLSERIDYKKGHMDVSLKEADYHALENTLNEKSIEYNKPKEYLEQRLNLADDWSYYGDLHKDINGFRPKEFPPHIDMNITYEWVPREVWEKENIDENIDKNKYYYFKQDPYGSIHRVSFSKVNDKSFITEEYQDETRAWTLEGIHSFPGDTLEDGIKYWYSDKVRFFENKEDVVPTLFRDRFTIDLEKEGVDWKRNLEADKMENEYVTSDGENKLNKEVE